MGNLRDRPRPPIVLGIDASLTSCGFAVLNPGGALTHWENPNGAGKSRWEQVALLSSATRRMLSQGLPEIVAIESNAGIRFHNHGDNARTMDAMGFCRGVIWAAIAEAMRRTRPLEEKGALEIREYSTDAVRSPRLGRALSGGTRPKAAVLNYLAMLGYCIPLNAAGNPRDGVADAILVALHAQQEVTLERAAR